MYRESRKSLKRHRITPRRPHTQTFAGGKKKRPSTTQRAALGRMAFERPTWQSMRTASNRAEGTLRRETLAVWSSKRNRIILVRPSARSGPRQVKGRHLRSKCRCSCVLQFTCRRAASCGLHRPTSQGIHWYGLYHFSSSLLSQAVLSDVRRSFRCQSKTEVQLSRVRVPLPSNQAHLADTVEPGCLQIKTKGTQEASRPPSSSRGSTASVRTILWRRPKSTLNISM